MTAVNNLYWVPIETIHFHECLDGGSLQGGRDTKTLVQADSPGEARIALRRLNDFADNYNDLPVEKRKGLRPFRFREGEIEQVLACDKRHESKRGGYTCGRPLYDLPGEPGSDDESVNGNGEFGMCCIDGYDIPEGLGCPYEPAEVRLVRV